MTSGPSSLMPHFSSFGMAGRSRADEIVAAVPCSAVAAAVVEEEIASDSFFFCLAVAIVDALFTLFIVLLCRVVFEFSC